MAYVPPHRRRQRRESPQVLINNRSSALRDVVLMMCINLNKRIEKWRHLSGSLPNGFGGLQRFSAVDGQQAVDDGSYEGIVQLEWDATLNSKYSSRTKPGNKCMTAGEVGCALSHISLWKQLIECEASDEGSTMLVLEDDVVFAGSRRNLSKFEKGLEAAYSQLPSDWQLFYLGISDRGERTIVDSENHPSDPKMVIFTPEYGFHTHAYIIKKSAAKQLLQQLPMIGPIDVWLADNKWFGLKVYSAVIAGEGWQREDGTFEGGLLVRQDRRRYQSDIVQSSEQ